MDDYKLMNTPEHPVETSEFLVAFEPRRLAEVFITIFSLARVSLNNYNNKHSQEVYHNDFPESYED